MRTSIGLELYAHPSRERSSCQTKHLFLEFSYADMNVILATEELSAKFMQNEKILAAALFMCCYQYGGEDDGNTISLCCCKVTNTILSNDFDELFAEI